MIEESKLIHKAKKADNDAFGALYDKYIKTIYRFVAVKVNTREEAEDITHEVFLSAWQNIQTYEPRGFPLSSWLYQIARNKIIDYYRSKRMPMADIEDVAETLAGPDDIAGELNVQLDFDRVKKSIKLLSSEYQDVILMRYMQDLSYEEIAKILGKSEGAIRILQHRAINNLKKIVMEENNKIKES